MCNFIAHEEIDLQMIAKSRVNCAINIDFVIIILTAFGIVAFEVRDTQRRGTHRVDCWVRKINTRVG